MRYLHYMFSDVKNPSTITWIRKEESSQDFSLSLQMSFYLYSEAVTVAVYKSI